MDGGDLLEHLRAENARLIALLESHGIEWRLPDELPKVEPVSSTPLLISSLDTDAKLALFRRLFRGRADVFPMRWESKAGKSGYSPACANEWRPGVCEKPRIKCGDCSFRQLLPLTDQVLSRVGCICKATVGYRTGFWWAFCMRILNT